MSTGESIVVYTSPVHKRRLARGLFFLGAVLLVLALTSINNTYRKRKAAGYDPLPAYLFVLPVAPVMFVGLGLWIGWGQTRIDPWRGTASRRPLGLAVPAKTVHFTDAEQIRVGYHFGPSTIATPGSGIHHRGGSRGPAYWFVRLEGVDFQLMLLAQRDRSPAIEFARRVAEFSGLPMEIADPPRSNPT